ncbi:MAG: general stress protein [Candidatus Omnitrophica bacterium]|nr:general stress protein [Candidatus Omnitrophota bacterium]
MAKIIAEFCQNHNGDLAILQEMVWAAKEAGADYAKIQTLFAEDLTRRTEFEEGRMENGAVQILKRPYQPEYDRMKRLELSEKDHELFIETCRKAGITPLTTVFSRCRIPWVKALGFKTLKIASIDCASFPMIEELAGHFDHLIISTGATFSHEIVRTAQILKSKQAAWTFLHCVSVYPTPLSRFNLRRMNFLKQFTPSVGLSDHSAPAKDGIKASVAALSLGAEWIERHFTILPQDQTKDGPVSINAVQLKELAYWARRPLKEVQNKVERDIPEYSSMLGTEDSELSHEELVNRAYYCGRFANYVAGEVVYNWEDKPVTSSC